MCGAAPKKFTLHAAPAHPGQLRRMESGTYRLAKRDQPQNACHGIARRLRATEIKLKPQPSCRSITALRSMICVAIRPHRWL